MAVGPVGCVDSLTRTRGMLLLDGHTNVTRLFENKTDNNNNEIDCNNNNKPRQG